MGEFTFDLVVAWINGSAPADLCNIGGTATDSPNPAPSPAVGSEYTVIFSDCVSDRLGERLAFDGAFTLTVTGVGGDLASDSYSLAATIALSNLTVTDDVGPKTFSGGMSFTRTAAGGGLTQTATNIDPSTPLTVAESGVIRSLSEFALGSTRDASGAYSWGNPGDAIVFTSSDITVAGSPAPLTLGVVTALRGLDPPVPAGSLRRVRPTAVVYA